MNKLTALPAPCATCPYRRDVPSGIWDKSEYAKLPAFDRETMAQPPGVFMCHSDADRTKLCTGWLQCHGFQLLSLRLVMVCGQVDKSVIEVMDNPTVPLFSSGQEACDHGMKDFEKPGDKAIDAIARIERKRSKV